MRNRVILVALIFVSLLLGLALHINGATDQKREQTLAMLKDMPKSERDHFNSDAIDFYKHNSKAAKEERKRLRTLYNQIQNDPECSRLTQTMEQYVDWVNRIGDPVKMREIQGQSIDERVETIKRTVQEELQPGTGAEIVSTERLRERIRESLPPELRDFAFPELLSEFDDWLTARYAEEKSKLSPEQLEQFPKFEKMYADMLRPLSNGSASAEAPGFPEKLALLQFTYSLGGPQRISMSGGWRRSVAATLRDEFLNLHDDDYLELLEKIGDHEKRRVFEEMNKTGRFEESLQRLLALAILERYPSFNAMRPIGSGRGNNPVLWGDEYLNVETLGAYLAAMTLDRRAEVLKMDPRFTNLRLRVELVSNAFALNDLLRYEQRGGSSGGGTPGGGLGQGGPPPDAPRDGPDNRGPDNRGPDGRGQGDARPGEPRQQGQGQGQGRGPANEPRREPPRGGSEF